MFLKSKRKELLKALIRTTDCTWFAGILNVFYCNLKLFENAVSSKDFGYRKYNYKHEIHIKITKTYIEPIRKAFMTLTFELWVLILKTMQYAIISQNQDE